MQRRARKLLPPILIASLLLTASCAHRMDRDDILEAQATGVQMQAGSRGPAEAGGVGAVDGGAVANDGSTATGDTTPGVGESAAEGATPSGGTGGGTAAPVVGSTSGGGTPAAANRSPVTIASIGTMSGVVGSAVASVSEGAEVWAAEVNANGGLDGHPVQFVRIDDGTDAARYKAGLQRAVEELGAIAFVGNPEAITGQSGTDYIAKAGVPFIGGDAGADWWYDYPNYFPSGVTGDTVIEAQLHDAKATYGVMGAKKMGIITCVEAPICTDAYNQMSANAGKFGFVAVYRGRASLAQPDFTAECLAAKNAGAEILEAWFDQNSIARMAANCARQDYYPYFGFPSVLARDSVKTVSAMKGARGTFAAFSWTSNSTPARQKFQDSMRRYGARYLGDLAAGHSSGYASGKMLERAVQLAGGLSDDPKPSEILKGLYQFRNETLGGLTVPLSFFEGKLAPRQYCYFSARFEKGQVINQNNGEYRCAR